MERASGWNTTTRWYALPIDRTLVELKSSEFGLSGTNAAQRLTQEGPNVISVRSSDTAWRIAVRQISNPLIVILLIATGFSFVLGASVDASIILGAVLINAIVGFFQERKVSVILEQLRSHIRSSATVVRDGAPRIIDAQEVVPGDILALRQGDRVPADARILSSVSFRTNEALLTGESMPVHKTAHAVADGTPVSDQTDMTFMGTFVEEGSAKAIVVATGVKTEFGNIAELIMRERKRDVTPLQIRLRRLAQLLGGVFLGISGLLFIVGVAAGREPVSMFLTAVAVAVAAVPESLPVSLSIVMAIGARRVLRRGGLIRKMAAAESLGSVSVIATDKTATLTEGNMAIERVVEPDFRETLHTEFPTLNPGGSPSAVRSLLERVAFMSNALLENPEASPEQRRFSGTPVDKALLRTAITLGMDWKVLLNRNPRRAELPFHARRKFAALVLNEEAATKLTMLGAPEVVLMRCSDASIRDRVLARAGELASDGLRVLALASQAVDWSEGKSLKDEHVAGLVFDGLIVLSDPIRTDVRDVIAVAQQAGTRVIMVTGDHANTAEYVARQVGITSSRDRLIEGAQLPEDPALISERYDIFARVTPEDKVRIVEGFKSQGYNIAMLGDGVNDAPALLRADIGVAVGSGTDVAKEASDLVLINDSFGIIVEAIRQGRIIFDNIRKVLLFLLSSAFTEMILVGGSILAGLPLPLLPAQILWVNIIADVFPAIALAWDKEGDDVMRQRPRRISDLFSQDIRKLIALFTVVTDGALFALYVWFVGHGSIEHARTMVFMLLGMTTLAYVFSVRSVSRPVWRSNPFSNRLLVGAVLLGLVWYAVALYVPPVAQVLGVVPLAVSDFYLIIPMALLNIAVFEFGKRWFLGTRSLR